MSDLVDEDEEYGTYVPELEEDEREGGVDELELIVRQMEKHLRAATASAARIRDLIEEL